MSDPDNPKHLYKLLVILAVLAPLSVGWLIWNDYSADSTASVSVPIPSTSSALIRASAASNSSAPAPSDASALPPSIPSALASSNATEALHPESIGPIQEKDAKQSDEAMLSFANRWDQQVGNSQNAGERLRAPSTAAQPSRIDPRKVNAIVARGVARYASAATDQDRAQAARLIQTAALVGFPLARDLISRHYARSQPVRSVVPANDAIRYALAAVTDETASEDSKQIFIALGRYFADHGQLHLFATQILYSLRGDWRPQRSHRVESLLDLLDHVPGSCHEIARILQSAGDISEQGCSASLSEKLREHIETTKPTGDEEERRGRGMLMLNNLDDN